MNDLISVVIPTYNRKDKLPACIESVLAQTYANLEVIVVDDASTDGTQHLFDAPGDPRVRYVRYEQNRGACYARNLGAQHARGSILAFQDSDDLWHADKLQKQYDLLMATGADLCYCGMNRVAASGSSFYYPVHAPRPGRALEDFLAENRAGTQTLLMHRAASAAIRTGTLPSARLHASGSCICRRHWSSPRSAATASPPSSSPTPTCCTCMKSTRRSIAASRTVTP